MFKDIDNGMIEDLITFFEEYNGLFRQTRDEFIGERLKIISSQWMDNDFDFIDHVVANNEKATNFKFCSKCKENIPSSRRTCKKCKQKLSNYKSGFETIKPPFLPTDPYEHLFPWTYKSKQY